MRRAILPLAILCICQVAFAQTQATPVALPAGDAIDFSTHIEPIFRAKCVGCHGARRQQGGLRLDAFAFASKGSESGRPLLGGKLEENEIYRRITTADEHERMPMGLAPLEPIEIERIKAWILAGSPWTAAVVRTEHPLAVRAWTADGLSEWTRRVDREVRFFRLWCVLAAGLGLFVALAAWLKTRYRRRAAGGERVGWHLAAAHKMRAAHVVAACLVAALAGAAVVIDWYVTRCRDLEQRAASQDALVRNLTAIQGLSGKQLYGWPPAPLRMLHPPALRRTYYRGNDERDERLYNGGNYLTAKFHIEPVDSAHKPLNVGDAFPQGGIFLRFEIERGRNTSENLFSDQITGQIKLSSRPDITGSEIFPVPKELADAPIVHCSTIETGQRWGAYYPIVPQLDEPTCERSGLVYVYYGALLHYGIKFDLKFVDGRLADGSELWMGNLLEFSVLAPYVPGTIPRSEWLDYREIPEVAIPNPDDPDLLGETQWLGEKGKTKPDDTSRP